MTRCHDSCGFLGRGAELRRLAREVYLHEHLERSSVRWPFNRAVVQLLEELERIHGLDAPERRRGLASFVRLEMTDEMPSHRSVGCPGDLLQRFLNAVLAEFPLTGRRGFVDRLDSERFRDRNESHIGGFPAGPLRRRSDPVADDREVVGDGHRAGYFLICVRMPFACSAYWPVGASLR